MSDERIKQLMAQTPLPESLSTYQAFKQLQNEMQQEINRLTAELATERRSNEKTYDHNNRLINEVDRLTAEVERLKRDLLLVQDDAKISKAELYRYKSAVEVEGSVTTLGLNSKADYETGCKLAQFFGQRVTVLVMAKEDGDE